MKLRNKKTGEIIDVYKGQVLLNYNNGRKTIHFKSLEELEEWEDYEEPKEFYVVDLDGEILPSDFEDKTIEKSKELGNYFETKEEAEKAVEKLKAWKRLKDKGFNIESWTTHIGDNYYKTGQIVLNLNNVRDREWDEYDQIMEIKNDLNLLFGGEE